MSYVGTWEILAWIRFVPKRVKFDEACGLRSNKWRSFFSQQVTRKSDRPIVVRKFANNMSVSNDTKHRGADGAKGSNNLERRIVLNRTATPSAESR